MKKNRLYPHLQQFNLLLSTWLVAGLLLFAQATQAFPCFQEQETTSGFVSEMNILTLFQSDFNEDESCDLVHDFTVSENSLFCTNIGNSNSAGDLTEHSPTKKREFKFLETNLPPPLSIL